MNQPAIAAETIAQRAALARLIDGLVSEDGMHPTAIDDLYLIRCSAPSEPVHGLHKPALCVIVQGSKEVRLGDERYTYDALRYLVVSVAVPVAGRVLEASPGEPYLCIRLDIDPALIATLVAEAGPVDAGGGPQRGLYLDRIDAPLLDATLRLVRLLDSPQDIAVLAPLALREIFYRLLRGQQGRHLHEIAVRDSQGHRVTRAIEWLNRNYVEPLRIDELAQRVNLSSSTLHHRFKALTAMSPLQYQKQLRLQEARRLLIAEGLDVSSAGYRVGYESPSQFSREYSRLFGASPVKDLARLRSIA
ncbi:AraC family transcriptional regulator [Pseudomonas lopnurensis]|uniref:AraC family transcriptional regulator n=1 Tax=Pseudomonas lopnurensis TaxID=1477517 RepID=UPI001879FF2F|nr:AraC family transcriptional regulator [Pseudomonas lopnurensis]MBE7376641.1 AraC family transcriptional regulator [Pseudomonas lopnurensis]